VGSTASRGDAAGSGERTRVQALRARHPWLDHLIRTGTRYGAKHGNHYAAAMTYFSVLALVPLLMIAFAVAGYVLLGDEQLLGALRAAIADAAPPSLAPTVNSIVDTAIDQRNTVGLLGLLLALYAGLGWMGNLREALSEQWDQHGTSPSMIRRYGGDLLALIGLGVALILSSAITAVGSELPGSVLGLLGLDDQSWARTLVAVLGVGLTLLADWVVFVWVIARLPREPVPARSAVRAAVLGTVGLVVLQQIMAIYLATVTTSPAGVAFGPVLGLLIFINVVSRFILFVTAWAATVREGEPHRISEPAPVIVRPAVTVGGRPGTATAAGLLGVGALLGALGGVFARRGGSPGG
jgi:membrane protein